MRPEKFEVPLRIVVEDPVPGLTVALQRGQAAKVELLPPVARSPAALIFDLVVTVDGRMADGRPRFLGPFVQGPPAARFVYLWVGAHPGQPGAERGGRIKVPLADLGWDALDAAPPGGRLCARIGGRSPRGGPALASVKLLPPGWTSGI